MEKNYTKLEKEFVETGLFSEYLPPCFKLDKKFLEEYLHKIVI